jgi:TetR/AcrR family transcriptional repressor of nem operon
MTASSTSPRRGSRRHSIDSLAVAELMKEAGLTHGGGFYGHFGSRDQRVTEAAQLALRRGR